MITSRTFIVCVACVAAFVILSTELLAERGRLMPPEQVRCNRDQLTSFTGVISNIEPTESGLRVTIKTDWATVEQVEVSGIESLQVGMRVTAWVCDDGESPPYIQRPTATDQTELLYSN